ncbi:MAG: hypothetical protein N2050_06190, partial [Flavobacteriales bacterium]|nr:hypothetical protein [Flavobacteriales bacterium]
MLRKPTHGPALRYAALCAATQGPDVRYAAQGAATQGTGFFKKVKKTAPAEPESPQGAGGPGRRTPDGATGRKLPAG